MSDNHKLDDVVAIACGHKPYTWDYWSQGISESQTLTPEGRRQATLLVKGIIDWLGEDWLPKSFERFRRFDGRHLPLLSLSWNPSNDTAHVFYRILSLGCQFRMFYGCPGFAKLRNNMRGDIGYFEHGLMQLEVASLGAKAGWSIEFEPRVSHSDSRGDVLLSRAGQQMMVEVKGFEADEMTRTDVRTSEAVGQPLTLMSLELDVTFCGDIEPDVPIDEIPGVLAHLRNLAVSAKRSGSTLTTTTPAGRPIEVVPYLREGVSHTMTIRHGDELRRLQGAIENKCQQTAGQTPVWLRVNETGLFWALSTPPNYPRAKFHAFLSEAIREPIQRYRHVAGVMLSGTPGIGPQESVEWENLDGASFSMFRVTTLGFCRETLLVAGPHELGLSHLDEWKQWYSDEQQWLPWALERLDMPQLSKLLKE